MTLVIFAGIFLINPLVIKTSIAPIQDSARKTCRPLLLINAQLKVSVDFNEVDFNEVDWNGGG